MKTKKMTVKYWNSLPEDSKVRAIEAALPNAGIMAKILKSAKPNPKEARWSIVFKEVRIPEDCSHYKTVVNGWYLP